MIPAYKDGNDWVLPNDNPNDDQPKDWRLIVIYLLVAFDLLAAITIALVWN